MPLLFVGGPFVVVVFQIDVGEEQGLLLLGEDGSVQLDLHTLMMSADHFGRSDGIFLRLALFFPGSGLCKGRNAHDDGQN